MARELRVVCSGCKTVFRVKGAAVVLLGGLAFSYIAGAGELDKALEMFEQLDRIGDWRALESLGAVLFSGSKYREATKAYERALVLLEKDRTVVPEKVNEVRYAHGRANAEWKCEGFYESIGKLAAEEQMQRVREKFQEIHGSPVGVTWTIKDGIIEYIALSGPELLWLQPLRGIQARSLNCYGSKIADLSPLKGMPLTYLNCGFTKVRDLSPLAGMPLTGLDCYNTPVRDLSPLKGMPLTTLNCQSTEVPDLSPLKGMRLTTLGCNSTQISDLSPLKGMPLTTLYCHDTQVSDLNPLAGMPLTTLYCNGTQISDLSPLKGMPLTTLECHDTQVSDLSPLAGMPLKLLVCSRTAISDLSPLKGMPLTTLHCSGTPVRDLSPLEGMKLEGLAFTPNRIEKGIEIIRAMKTLNRLSLNGQAWFAPADFWKKYDAGEFNK